MNILHQLYILHRFSYSVSTHFFYSLKSLFNFLNFENFLEKAFFFSFFFLQKPFLLTMT